MIQHYNDVILKEKASFWKTNIDEIISIQSSSEVVDFLGKSISLNIS